jgi:hypothetical protein
MKHAPDDPNRKAMNRRETLKPMKWREAIGFLIGLAAIDDPEKLRPGDRLNLIDDLRRYFDIEVEGALARDLTEAEKRPSKLIQVIEVVRKLADAVVSRQRVVISPKEKIAVVFDGRRLGDERGARSSDGRLADVMAGVAADDFSDAEPWQVCRCKECGKFFLAARKGQIFCRHACASAASSREYRASHAKERAQRQRKRYWQKKIGDAEISKET